MGRPSSRPSGPVWNPYNLGMLDEIIEEYVRSTVPYDSFSGKLETLVKDVLTETRIRIHSVSSRVRLSSRCEPSLSARSIMDRDA